MKRRAFVVALGGLLTAGCSSTTDTTTAPPDGGETDAPTATRPETHTSSTVPSGGRFESRTGTATPTTEQSLPPFDPASTYRTVAVGDRNAVDEPADARPHTLRIWNDDTSSRRIEVRITTGGPDGESVLDGDFEVPGDAALAIELLEPATYTVELRVPADGGDRRYVIAHQTFDCNSHEHQVSVRPDGRIRIVEIATTMACL